VTVRFPAQPLRRLSLLAFGAMLLLPVSIPSFAQAAQQPASAQQSTEQSTAVQNTEAKK